MLVAGARRGAEAVSPFRGNAAVVFDSGPVNPGPAAIDAIDSLVGNGGRTRRSARIAPRRDGVVAIVVNVVYPLAKIAGQVFGNDVQAYPKYGSEKKGLPTTYYLTIAESSSR